MTNSYYARVVAGKGVLLGGTKVHESVRFENRSMACDWADTVKYNNLACGRDVGAVAIIPSSKAPEIICLKTMLEGE